MWNISPPENALNTFCPVWSLSGCCFMSWKDQTVDALVHPPKHGTALQGLHGWMQIFGSTGGCMECQAQDCCVGSCSSGSNRDQTQCGLRRCVTIVRQTPWGSLEQHSWRCWSIASPASEWQNYPVLWKQQPLFCESPLPSQLFAFPRAVLLMGAEAGGLFVLELACMKWEMLQSLSKALHIHRLYISNVSCSRLFRSVFTTWSQLWSSYVWKGERSLCPAPVFPFSYSAAPRFTQLVCWKLLWEIFIPLQKE